MASDHCYGRTRAGMRDATAYRRGGCLCSLR